MIFDCNTSVATLKLRTLTTPMMHSTRMPAIIASTPAVSPPFMFVPMMLAPASPKPSASNEPSLMIVFSRMTVSIGAEAAVQKVQVATSNKAVLILSRCALARRAFATSSALNSSSAICMAIKGLSRIDSTRWIIRSTGCTMSWLASLLNISDTPTRSTKIQNVMMMLNAASACTKGRKSNQKIRWWSLYCLVESNLGYTPNRSCSRKSSGHATTWSTTPEMLFESNDTPFENHRPSSQRASQSRCKASFASSGIVP
mmetsp:Transcript_15315/g.44279  ORF Transcript_15315/g.44279 Transcript_15315/m.44279 type:complete len:257 (+) Transcript_15315:1061-1831(+)